MTIHLDTSFVVDLLTGERRAAPRFESASLAGHVPLISAPVLFEWLRGPRTAEQLADQRELFPDYGVASFTPSTAIIAAELYRALTRPRSREMDIAIAACAIEHDAAVWTLNPADFADIPGLLLYRG